MSRDPRQKFALYASATLAAYAVHGAFVLLAFNDIGLITCGVCTVTSVSSLVTGIVSAILLLRSDHRKLLRYGHAFLAAFAWLVWGMPGILFAANGQGIRLATGLAGLGMVLGLLWLAPWYLGAVWVGWSRWSAPPRSPAAPARIDPQPSSTDPETAFVEPESEFEFVPPKQ